MTNKKLGDESWFCERMIYRIGKIFIYSVISLIVSSIIFFGNNDFFHSFRNNLVALLATLVALYMTAYSIIIVQIYKLKEKYPESKSDPQGVIKGIKNVFIIQLILIIVTFLSFIIKDILVVQKVACDYYVPAVTILSNALAIAIFGYFIEALYDMGQTLFMLIQFNNKRTHETPNR